MPVQSNEMLSELQRMSQLLALVAIRGVDEAGAIVLLSRAGFGNGEIGRLLGLTTNAVKLRVRRQRRTSRKVKSTHNGGSA